MTRRIAVIGAGGMGREHLRNLAAMPGVDVEVVADVDPAAADAGAAIVGAAATTDAAHVAAQPSLDGVVIASSDDSHAALAIAAMEAGTRVLCEKPLASTIVDAQRVVDAETANGRRLLQVGFMREYDLAHRQVEDALGRVGPLRHLRGVHRNANGAQAPRTLEEILVQSIIHDLHTARWLCGAEVATVQTSTVTRGTGVGFVHLAMEMTSGALVTVDFDDEAFGYEVTVEVDAARGMVSSAPPVRAAVSVEGDRGVAIGTDWFGWFTDAYRMEISAWVASLTGAAAVGPSAWDGLAAQLAVEAAVASAAAGGAPTAVDMPPAPALYT